MNYVFLYIGFLKITVFYYGKILIQKNGGLIIEKISNRNRRMSGISKGNRHGDDPCYARNGFCS